MKRSGALRRKWPACSVIGAGGSARVSEQQPRLFLRRLADSVQQKSRFYPALLTHVLHLRTNSRYQNLLFLHVTSCGDTGVRAKMAQETRIKFSRIPYTIVRSTQFFEFVGSIAQNATEGATVRLPSVLMQPIGADDVAAALADVACGEPINGTVEIAGPEQIRQDELVRQFLSTTGDAQKVITDVHARYYGLEVDDQSLVPGHKPRLGSMHFAEWLNQSTPPRELRKAA